MVYNKFEINLFNWFIRRCAKKSKVNFKINSQIKYLVSYLSFVYIFCYSTITIASEGHFKKDIFDNIFHENDFAQGYKNGVKAFYIAKNYVNIDSPKKIENIWKHLLNEFFYLKLCLRAHNSLIKEDGLYLIYLHNQIIDFLTNIIDEYNLYSIKKLIFSSNYIIFKLMGQKEIP